jgi:hypothetical protein
LTIASCLPLPGVRPGQGEPQVWVREGVVPAHLEGGEALNARCEARPGQLLFHIADTASYLIASGREITLQRAPGASDAAVALYLLASAIGALLWQRGLFLLHGSAVVTPRGAVVFSGEQGAGKSTLLRAFLRRGYRFLSDDICAVTLREGMPWLLPAFPQVKLWADSAARFGEEEATLRRVHPDLDKFGLPLEEQFCPTAQPLRAVYLIGAADEALALTPLQGAAKFSALAEETYRPYYVPALGRRPEHFRQCASLAQQVEVARLARPRDLTRLDEVVAFVERAL